MLRFSWNQPRRCVRLRGVVLIDEIGNHLLTWLVRKRSVSPPNLAGSSQKPLQNMHVPFGALWCVEFSVVAEPRGILDSLHTHTHPLTHSLAVCLARDRLQNIAYFNQAQHHAPCNQSYTHVKPLTTEKNTSFRLLVHFMLQNHQDPSSRVRAP